MRRFLIILAISIMIGVSAIDVSFGQLEAYDWPMWRYDANRSASSPQELPEKLYLQWVREYPKLDPTWDDPLNQDLMQFGKFYEPVVMGKTLFVGSSASDWLTALDTETGEEKWTFYADGPIRLPLIANNGKVYFSSDDGYLYCLNADEGKLLWKFRGGPNERKVLGNERIISTWPARGGPVLKDGIVYFAASIWPFMGIFIYALDAETGKVVWVNDGTGSKYMLQPHNSPSYAGVAPQGSLVIAGDKLLIPCGRSVPACFDLRTGEMLYYHLAKYNKTGGAFVAAHGDFFVNYHRDYVTSLYNVENGEILISRFGKIPVMTDGALFSMGDKVVAYKPEKVVKYEKKEVKDKGTEIVKVDQWVANELWSLGVDATGDLVKAGNRLYAGGKGIVSAIDIPKGKERPEISWQVRIDGTASRIIAADGKLFVVTLEGNIFVFGGDELSPKIHQNTSVKLEIDESTLKQVNSILEKTGIKEGYCLAYGLDEGNLIGALAEKSNLRITAVDTDTAKVDQLRRRFRTAGLLGKRLSFHAGDPFTFKAPPYVASLTVFENLEKLGSDMELPQLIYRSMRPYGGAACVILPKFEASQLAEQLEYVGLYGAKTRIEDTEIPGQSLLILTREGPLPGASDWTHQYGDIANTVKSDDKLVRLPLGLLWFGGNSNMDVLPRHGHGPSEQVIGGRLFIEGIGLMNARDVYTGRVIWQRKLPKMDTYEVFYDDTYKDTPLDTAYNQVHIPGANARGTNYVATLDKVYIAQKGGCLVLDAATGEILTEFRNPKDPNTGKPVEWGYIGVYKDYLIAGAGFVSYEDFIETETQSPYYNYDITSSKKLVVMDRHSGEILWEIDSKLGFRHSGITVGDDKLFCIDRLPDPVKETLKRRGEEYPTSGVARLAAYDLKDGKEVWNTTENIFGTWLSYSEEYGILLQATRSSRDMLREEPNKKMVAYDVKDGDILWSSEVSYGGPVMLHNDTIITDRYAYSILNGEQRMRKDPLTGEESPWEFKRNYGCNYVIASEYLMTFRSAAAGFYDLYNDGGTGNFGGFKSGCTSNLVPAGGVLNAPEYTRTCSCSYQNQTSLAMVYDPDVEIWTEYHTEPVNRPIKTVGINFGAPGDRMSDDNILWLEYPKVGGPSPEVKVSVTPENYERSIHHSSKFSGNRFNWVGASGIEGLSSLTINLAENSEKTPPIVERPYTISLYFAEPDDIKPGQRVFDVIIQGQRVLDNFDIVKEARRPYRIVIKEFKGIMVKDDLKLEFISDFNGKAPLICGIEIRGEGW